MDTDDITAAKILPVAAAGIILVIGLTIWLWQTPLTPEQAIAGQFADARMVDSRIVQDHQVVLHTKGGGEEVVASLLAPRALLGWDLVASGSAAVPEPQRLASWGALTLDQLASTRVAVYGYVGDVLDVRAIYFADYEVPIRSDNHFLYILPEGMPAPTADEVVVETYDYLND